MAIARMARDTDTPGKEFKVAIGGPVVTLLIVVACAIAGAALAVRLRSSSRTPR